MNLSWWVYCRKQTKNWTQNFSLDYIFFITHKKNFGQKNIFELEFFFGQKLFGTKKISRHFFPKFCLYQIFFFRPHFFLAQHFFPTQIFFLTKIFFWQNLFYGLTFFFWPKIFSGPKIILDQPFFGTKFFLDKFFLVQNFFSYKFFWRDFSSSSFFYQKYLSLEPTNNMLVVVLVESNFSVKPRPRPSWTIVVTWP